MELGKLFAGFVLGFVFITRRKPTGFLLGFFLPRTTTLPAVLSSGTDATRSLLDFDLNSPMSPHAISEDEELSQDGIHGGTLVIRACPGQAMHLGIRNAALRRVVAIKKQRVRPMLNHAQVSRIAGVVAKVAFVVIHSPTPFLQLQGRHIVWRFSNVVGPPFDSGTT